jgi:hypothetical protein
MAISLSDFQNWKADPVTRAFFQACQERIEDAKNTLSVSAGNDSGYDRQVVGVIQADLEGQE